GRLVGLRGQAGEVEREAPDQNTSIGSGCMRQLKLLEVGEDEPVDRVANPGRFLDRGRLDSLHRLIGPVAALVSGEGFGGGKAVRSGRLITRQRSRGEDEDSSRATCAGRVGDQARGALFHGESRPARLTVREAERAWSS